MPTLTPITVGAFCRELVCGLDTLPDLLDSWGLTEDEFLQLRKGEAFQKELKAAVEDVRSMGPDSAFIVRCKVLSEMFLENVVGMMGDRLTPPEVRAALFRQITELARLHPAKTAGPLSSAPLVTFNFGEGMPGMPRSLTINADTDTDLDTPMVPAHGDRSAAADV